VTNVNSMFRNTNNHTRFKVVNIEKKLMNLELEFKDLEGDYNAQDHRIFRQSIVGLYE